MEGLLPGLVILHAVCLVAGFPNGAPTSACEDMMPRHAGVQPQPTRAPYAILTNSKTFQPGQPITVIIYGPDYRGVLLEARTETSPNALGNWRLPPPDTKFLQCSGNSQGAITHANTNLKGNTTTFSWMPPSTINSVYFMATVAQQRTVYWLNIRSAFLTKGAEEGIGLATGGCRSMASEGFMVFLTACVLVSQVLLR
ncbi:putative defense protein 3 [Hypomesus transpacificus]|uniref:putative defense protein 3 n=1 Tax=Hypomesus transpacificus TaxID=137520 RepID=UPI001F07816C|nr:putative defense protein 3 [Hypomesus transpacificus]